MNNDEKVKYLNNQFEESVEENIIWEKLYNELSEENEALREQFKKAKEVIEFYADSKNWKFETLLNYENWGGERAEYFLFKLELEGEK